VYIASTIVYIASKIEYVARTIEYIASTVVYIQWKLGNFSVVICVHKSFSIIWDTDALDFLKKAS
jgi:hypothetical protein